MMSLWICGILFVSKCLILKTDVFGEIVKAPRDTQAMVGQMTFFNCSTSFLNDLKEIAWYFFPIGKEDRYIYSRGLFNNFGDRFQVNNDPSTGTIDLIIPSVEERDAGGYECEDEGGLGRHSKRRAQLIILEPIYKSNMSSDGVIGPNDCDIEPEYFQLSCSVPYLGNIPPTMEWKKLGNNSPITTGLSVEKSSNLVTFKLAMKGDLDLDGSTYVCQTTRSATKQYNCTSDQVKILYFLKTNTTGVITVGDSIVCSVNSSQSCNYAWSWFSILGDPLQTLTGTLNPISAGTHKCEARCYMRDKTCLIEEAMLVMVTEKVVMSTDSESTSPSKSIIVAAVLVPLLAVIVASVSVSILVYFILKKRRTIEKYKETTNLIQTIETKKEKSRRRAISRMTILDEELFMLNGEEKDSNVEVFDSNTLDLKRSWSLSENYDRLIAIVSSKKYKCLYVIGVNYRRRLKFQWSRLKSIVRVDLNGKIKDTWLIRNNDDDDNDDSSTSLSVTDKSNVILNEFYQNNLIEYSPKGRLITEVKLSYAGIIHPWHAIKLTNGHFMVSYGDDDDPVHGVCIVNTKGAILKSFGGERGFSDIQLNHPVYFAENEDGSVLVVDQKNSRILLLSAELEFKREILSKEKDGLRRPFWIHLDQSTGHLFVADNEWDEENLCLVDGQLLIFNIR